MADEKCIEITIPAQPEILNDFPLSLVLTATGSGSAGVDAKLEEMFDLLTPVNVDDGFTGVDGEVPNTKLWEVTTPSGLSCQIKNNTLNFNVSNSALLAGYARSRYNLSGDFDVEIDFEIFEQGAQHWTGRLLVTDDFSTYNNFAFISRANYLGTKYDSTIRFNGSSVDDNETATTDLTGKLRIVRGGSNVTCFYWNGSSWDSLCTYSNWITSDVLIELAGFTSSSTLIDFYFDNFKVNYGSIVWPDTPTNLKIIDKATDLQCFIEKVFWDYNNRRCQLVVNVPEINSSSGASLQLWYDPANGDNSVRSAADASDDFTGTDGDLPRNDLWSFVHDPVGGIGGTASLQSNKLHFEVSAESSAPTVQSKFALIGDFSVQVDYNLDATPSPDQDWQFGLRVCNHPGDIASDTVFAYMNRETASRGPYRAAINGVTPVVGGNADLGGSFRIRRVGSVLYCDYNPNDTGWVNLLSGDSLSTDPLYVAVMARMWSVGGDLICDYDNFIVNSAGSITGFIGDTGSVPAQQVWDGDYKAVYHMTQDPSGGTDCVIDSVGNAPGTPQGSMVSGDLIDTAYGKAITTDGTDDWFDCGDSDILDGATSFTLEWFGSISNYNGGALIRKWGPGQQSFLLAVNTTTGELVAGAYQDASNYTIETSNGAVSTNLYHHLAAIWKGGTDIDLFVDGVLVGSTTGNSGSPVAINNSTEHLSLLGRYNGGVPDTFTQGQSGEIRISDKVKSDTEIAATAAALSGSLVAFGVIADQTFPISYLSQLWRLSPGDPVLPTWMEQIYAITAYSSQATLEQVWGLKLFGTLIQYYGDASKVIASLIQIYGAAPTPINTLEQRYGEAVQAIAALAQAYDLRPGLIALLMQHYSIAGNQAAALLDQPYDLQDRDQVQAVLNQVWALAGESGRHADLAGQGLVSAEGHSFYPAAISIEAEQDIHWMSCELQTGKQADVLALPREKTFTVAVAGTTFVFRVENQREVKRHGQVEYVVSGLSPAAWLDEPYADPVSGELTGLASALAAELAGDIILHWQTVDWYIGPGIWFAADESPMALLHKLAAAVGAMVQSCPDGSLQVAAAYPEPVSQWVTSPVAATMLERLSWFDLSPVFEHRPGYNRFLISDQLTTAESLRLEEEAISETRKEIRGYQTPWEGNFSLWHTGGSWVVIEPMGVEERQVTEVVEVVAGTGQTRYPVYAKGPLQWLQTNLGTVTWAEDGRLKADVEGESLLSITYTTRCLLWLVHNPRNEQLQLVADLEEVSA